MVQIFRWTVLIKKVQFCYIIVSDYTYSRISAVFLYPKSIKNKGEKHESKYTKHNLADIINPEAGGRLPGDNGWMLEHLACPGQKSNPFYSLGQSHQVSYVRFGPMDCRKHGPGIKIIIGSVTTFFD